MDSTMKSYQKLIKQVLVENNVKSIVNTYGDESNFFDRVEVDSNGDLKVYHHGVEFDNFLYDFTCEYSRCLSYIEDEIFLQSRLGKSLHGYIITFNNNK
ncbi:MAG: hypothetical protein J6X18_02735 [Bacteroidales bacterium]|nr:hypothetical protein [Bacteroidales bacterium]